MSLVRLLCSIALLCVLSLGVGRASELALRDFTAKSVADIRAAQAGRPFVLALWSVHCEPCLREMGRWGPLQRKYSNIPIILVTTDPLRERRKVVGMLARFDVAGVQTWQFADEFEEKVRYSIDPKWRGELPRTYLFDGSGGVQSRSGPADLAWIEPWLAQHAKP